MKKLIIFTIISTLIVSIVFAEPNHPDAQIAQLEQTIEQQDKTIKWAKKMIAKLTKQLTKQEKENNRLLILCRKAGIDTALPKPQNNLNSQAKLDNQVKFDSQAKHVESPLKIGQIIYFDKNDNFRVRQIIDKQNMIVDLRCNQGFTIGGDECYSPYIPLVWVCGIDTSKYVDETIIESTSEQFYKVTSTKQYDTAIGGTNTVFVIEPFISTIEEILSSSSVLRHNRNKNEKSPD